MLTPEEWVRRHLIAYLVSHCGCCLNASCRVCRAGQRTAAARDVVVVGDGVTAGAGQARPEIRIDERTLSQAVRYNSVLGARFVILTNGLRHYCCEYRDGKYVQLSGFPDFSAL
ncbi:MAG: type I restriction enzyme HsdR N-terminal domain-containing protein [Alistipes finegoldii]